MHDVQLALVDIICQGWRWSVEPARRCTAEEVMAEGTSQEDLDQWNEDYPDGLIEACHPDQGEGWVISVRYRQPHSKEFAYSSIAYPEDEPMFDTWREAADYIKAGFALEDFKRAQLGDNPDFQPA